MNADSETRIIVALDYASAAGAEAFVEKVSPELCKLKVGKELFTAAGPDFVRGLANRGFQVFLDLKFHDIPNTVAGAVAAAADLGAWMVNVHTMGGRRMMEAAAGKLQAAGADMLLTGVTVLTSMTGEDLEEVGITQSPEAQVRRLSRLARDSGLHGVVCSPWEAGWVRDSLGEDFLRVTPGIRPANAGIDDQRRIMTPEEAVTAGSSYLVIGRPITRADDPVAVMVAIREQVGE